MTASLRIMIASAFAALAATAAPATAQSLLDDLLPQPAGTCTCAVMEPPNNCDAIIAEPRQIAQAQRREIRAQCATDWTAGCEEQYGWQACASAEAQAQRNAQCDTLVDQWWTEVAAPQINDMQRQCSQANAGWIEHCETVERPANCATCDEMASDLTALETDIADTREWLGVMRSGTALLTPADEEEIAQRLDDLERWERELSERRSGYSMLLDSEFCPRV